MGLNVGGNTVAASGSGIAINTNFVFDANGFGTVAGLSGMNGSLSGGSRYQSTGSGWVANNVGWSSGYNAGTGVFTAPVAGYYAVGFNGILNGGSNIPSGQNTFGYSGFAKNGALSYFNHWNVTGSAWNNGGFSATFYCTAGDTLALYVNQSPTPTSQATFGSAYNYGAYPDNHHCMWVVLIG
jgi:hypothetical protein